MSSNALRIGAAGFFLVGLGLAAVAQQPVVRPGTTVPPAVGTAPGTAPAADATTTYRAKQILGSKVMIQNNTAAGTVDDIVFDTAGNLEYLIVSHNNKLVTVPWDAAKWNLKDQTAVVNVTPQVFSTIPTYTTTTYPDFWAPTYREQVYKTYGMTPRQLRRMERGRP